MLWIYQIDRIENFYVFSEIFSIEVTSSLRSALDAAFGMLVIKVILLL